MNNLSVAGWQNGKNSDVVIQKFKAPDKRTGKWSQVDAF